MNLHSNLSVTYETQILENGRVVKSNPPKRNLLLDSGLDQIGGGLTFWDSFAYCVLGDGTTPTKRDSGAITVSITGGVATASAGYFEANDVDRLLKLDSGQEVYIDGFTSATEVSVTGASDDAASEATIWYVNETGHANELVRTNNLGNDSGDVSSTWDGTKAEHKRTFIFPQEGSARTYREIGWSPSSGAGGNLFGRDIIPGGGGDSISAGQQYKVIVRLQIEINPITITSVPDVGTGWDTSGEMIITHVGRLLDGAESGGTFDTSKYTFETKTEHVWMHRVSIDFTLPTSPDSNVGDSDRDFEGSRLGYNPKSFYSDVRFIIPTNEGNGTWHGFGISGGELSYAQSEFIRIKFDTPQTKDSDHKLTLIFRQSWGRTLTN